MFHAELPTVHESLPLGSRSSFLWFASFLRARRSRITMRDTPRSAIILAKLIVHSLDAFRQSAQLLSQEPDTLISTQLGCTDNEGWGTEQDSSPQQQTR